MEDVPQGADGDLVRDVAHDLGDGRGLLQLREHARLLHRVAGNGHLAAPPELVQEEERAVQRPQPRRDQDANLLAERVRLLHGARRETLDENVVHELLDLRCQSGTGCAPPGPATVRRAGGAPPGPATAVASWPHVMDFVQAAQVAPLPAQLPFTARVVPLPAQLPPWPPGLTYGSQSTGAPRFALDQSSRFALDRSQSTGAPRFALDRSSRFALDHELLRHRAGGQELLRRRACGQEQLRRLADRNTGGGAAGMARRPRRTPTPAFIHLLTPPSFLLGRKDGGRGKEDEGRSYP